MNRAEYLIVKVSEESHEFGQRACKAACFGMDEIQPGQDLDNRERMWGEFADLCGILEMLFPTVDLIEVVKALRPQIDAKKVKVEKFMRYSETCGTLAPSPAEDLENKPCDHASECYHKPHCDSGSFDASSTPQGGEPR